MIKGFFVFVLSLSLCSFPFCKWVRSDNKLEKITHIEVDADWVADDAYNRIILSRKKKKKKKN